MEKKMGGLLVQNIRFLKCGSGRFQPYRMLHDINL